MSYHQLALILDAATRDPKPRPLPLTSSKTPAGQPIYNCSECLASRSVIKKLDLFQCAHCGQTFYQTEFDFRQTPRLTG